MSAFFLNRAGGWPHFGMTLWGMALVVGLAGGCAAGPDSAEGSSSSTPPGSGKMITGSRLPQKIEREGTVPDTVSPVYVIDREAMDRSGASTVAELLSRLPFIY